MIPSTPFANCPIATSLGIVAARTTPRVTVRGNTYPIAETLLAAARRGVREARRPSPRGIS